MLYCDRELLYLLKDKGYPIYPIPVGGQKSGIPVIYDLPSDHPDWANCDAYHPPTLVDVHTWLRKSKHISVVVHCISTHQAKYTIFDIGNDFSVRDEKHVIELDKDAFDVAILKGIKAAVRLLDGVN